MVESLASLCAIALVLAVVDGRPTTTSLDVARHFGKRHDDVLRLIRSLLSQLPAEHARNFTETFNEIAGPNGAMRKEPAYHITRDGFTLLAMGFTGKKALQFKLAYIDAFNRMEAQLSAAPALAAPAPLPALPPAPAPRIDPRALLLSGQSDPVVPIPPALDAAINKQAWAMAHEAYELTRQHLARRVAFRHVFGSPKAVQDVRGALADIRSVTLGQALVHEYITELNWSLSSAESAARTTQIAAEKMRKQIKAVRPS